MVLIWVVCVLVLIVAIVLTVYSATTCETGASKAISIVIIWAITLAIIGGMMWLLYGTESGKRLQKSLHSEVSGGLNRTVKVYDMEGDLIQEYKGKFDVAESTTEGVTKVKFDCDGKRHIIYGSTGTIIIDEE